MKRQRLTTAQEFIFAHAYYFVAEFGWAVAAQQALKKIEDFESGARLGKPPVMDAPNWRVIKEEIRAIAKGGSECP